MLKTDYFRNEDEETEEDTSKTRLSWNLEVFHDVQVDPNAPKWRRVFQRGIGMRRNICQGTIHILRKHLWGVKNVNFCLLLGPCLP